MITGKEEKKWYKPVKDLGYNIVNITEKEFRNPKKISIAIDYGEERETKLYAHDIILTTLDSYISRLYRSSMTPRRYRDIPIARIFNSTTIFDEAHMYDNYTHTLMKFTLRLLREGKAHHIIMTATMNENLINYLELNSDNYTKIQVEDLDWMNFTGSKKIKDLIEYKNKEDLPIVIKQIVENNHIKNGLIVCNSVEKAQRTYEELNKYLNGNVLLLHSRFKSDHRRIKEEQIKEFIKQNKFIVSTQVIEAGLDISVPNLITEVASGDSLVQRIGRCARRKGGNGQIFILYSNDEKEYLPYPKKEIEHIILGLKDIPKDYTFDLEKQMINTVIPPNPTENAEARARGIILSAFTSLSAFGDAWINVPTRDAKPVYLYCGSKKDFEKEKESLRKQNHTKNILINCVRVDLKFLNREFHQSID